MYSLQLGIYLGFVDTWLNKLGTVCQDNERLKKCVVIQYIIMYIQLSFSMKIGVYGINQSLMDVLCLSHPSN